MFHPWSYMDAIYLRSLVFSLLLSSTGDGGAAARPRFFCWTAIFSWTPSRTDYSHTEPTRPVPFVFLRASTTRTTACPLPRPGYYAHHDNTSRRFSYALLRRAPPTTAMSLIYESD